VKDSRPARGGRRTVKRILGRNFRRSYDRQSVWEQKWHRWMTEGSSPLWNTESLPAEVEEAIETGWLPAEATIVDIGCGSGELAALLAERGFEAVGLDFASSAIAQAREQHAVDRPDVNLTYEVADICGDVEGLGTFDALIDRGCFYGLDEAQHAAYADNVASLCEPGTPFLMMCPIRDAPAEQRVATIGEALGSHFAIERTELTSIGSGGSGRSIRAVTVWMIRV